MDGLDEEQVVNVLMSLQGDGKSRNVVHVIPMDVFLNLGSTNLATNTCPTYSNTELISSEVLLHYYRKGENNFLKRSHDYRELIVEMV